MNYKCIQKLGEGTYGVVQKAYDETNSFVAIKTYKDDDSDDSDDFSEIAADAADVNDHMELTSVMVREISILRSLQHENIVRLIKVIHTDRVHLVFELLDTDLHKMIKTCGKIDAASIKIYTQQLLLAVAYCHERGILHRDIKPQNVFIGQDGRTIKLGDFGLARSNTGQASGRFTPVVCTLWYRAPEVFLRTSYSSAIDVWSVGCVLGEMIVGRALFAGDDDQDMVKRIMARTEKFAGWPEALKLRTFKDLKIDAAKIVLKKNPPGTGHVKDLLLTLLNVNPYKRIGAAEALHHVYFTIL